MIKCFLGSMFSGKTSAMLDEIDKANIAGLQTLVLKYDGDNRYCNINDNKIVTHSRREFFNPNGRVISVSDLGTVDVEDAQVVAIDEFQFMRSPQQVLDWVSQNKDVYISALDGDYKQRIFENVSYIIPHADEIVKLKAVCMNCRTRNSAIFSKRIVKETEQILIGGDDKYIAVCRKCYLKDAIIP